MSVDIQKLAGNKFNAKYARTSILEFNAVLRRKDGGLSNSEQVPKNLGIEDEVSGGGSRARSLESPSDGYEGKAGWQIQPAKKRTEVNINKAETFAEESALHSNQQASANAFLRALPSNSEAQVSQLDGSQYLPDTPNVFSSQHQDPPELEYQTLDVFQPFSDPAMLDLFPKGDIPDLSEFDTNPLDLDYFELEGWEDNPGDMVGLRHDSAAAWNLQGRSIYG